MRAVIYARYSSHNQREASIEDQVRLCRTQIVQEGWVYLHAYTDRALSGASTLRPAYQDLLQDARDGVFDVAVAESLVRFSRDLEHVAAIFKQFSFAGIKLVTLAEGEITELHVGLKGTMNALYLKDLAQKTWRGLEGRVREGKSGRRALLWIQRRTAGRSGWSVGQRRARNQQGRSRYRQSYFPRIGFRPFAAGDRASIEPRRDHRSTGQFLGTIDHLRELAPRYGNIEQRTLHRTTCLEPPALHKRPRHRKTSCQTEPESRMGHRRRASSPHRR